MADTSILVKILENNETTNCSKVSGALATSLLPPISLDWAAASLLPFPPDPASPKPRSPLLPGFSLTRVWLISFSLQSSFGSSSCGQTDLNSPFKKIARLLTPASSHTLALCHLRPRFSIKLSNFFILSAMRGIGSIGTLGTLGTEGQRDIGT